MKRRAFLAGLSGVPAVSQSPAVPDAPLHPRVQLARDDLLKVITSVSSAEPKLTIRPVADLKPEEWEIGIHAGEINIRGDNRGIVYALSHLSRMVLIDRAVPESLTIRRAPYFKTRRWSTAVSHNFGSPWDERIHLAERLSYIKSDVIPRAAGYGSNSIELNGRPDDGWDTDWVIGFENYPELARLYPAGERKRRMELVEDLAQEAHRNLLDCVVWGHELHLPPGFTDLYPQVAGTEYPVCLSNDFLKQFIRDKYIEFFRGCPSVDGIVLSVNESGQFSLITDQGCRCDRCIRLSQHGRLMAVLNPVIEVAGELKKQVVLRTFQSSWLRDLDSHPELETIRKAYTGLPPQVVVMSKYCPLDFYGTAIADEPLIGAFPNPHLVEFSLDVEWQGRTFVPALMPEHFRRRIAHAVDRKCEGIVARIDFPFPSMEPGDIFGHPNEFNAWYMGELLWNPQTDIDESLSRWSRLRYGGKAAPILANALRKTEEITQKTFFCQGQTLINYHNMIASVSFSDDGLWSRALSKWDSSKRALSKSLFEPNDSLIAAAATEKAEALRSANEMLQQLLALKGLIPEPEFERLRCWCEKLRDSAELWGHLTELYLRHRQQSSAPAAGLTRLLENARLSLDKSVQMEQVHGANSWPVHSPDRGITAYEFVHQVLRNYISPVTGEPAATKVKWQNGDATVTDPLVAPDSVENFWRSLIEVARPRMQIGSQTELTLKCPTQLAEIRLFKSAMKLQSRDGATIELPLPYPVREVAVNKDGPLTIRKHVRDLSIQPA